MAAGTYLVARSYVAQIGINNSSFYNMGASVLPNGVANGTTVSTYIVPGFVSYTPSTFAYELVYSYASEQVRGRRDLGVTDYGIGQIVLSEYDELFNQYIGGATPNTTLATTSVISSPNALQKNFPRVNLTLTAGAIPVSSANNYVNINLPNVTIRPARPGTNQGTGKNPNNLTFDIVVSAASRASWGSLLSALSMGLTNSYDTELLITTAAPLIITTYVDDASATSVTIPYTPYSTEHAGAVNIITKNGVDNHAAVSGISGKIFTITPGTAGDIWEFAIPCPFSGLTFG